MKKILFIFAFLFCVTISFAQNKTIDTNITRLKWVVNSKEEFKEIKWNDVRKMIRNNNKDSISLTFTVKPSNKNKIVTAKISYEIKGLSENRDDMIKISKKIIKLLNK